ncbi:DUF5703 domain-containing protein [Puia sp. P3]|uniref:DUF5703 domain-containing protein n=1 Tax=Puia sp. P3 TaxID=3423952 RepID=UPI003D6689DB
MKQGGILSKVGRIRVKAGGDMRNFRQVLRLREGEIEVTEGDASYRVWVDANHPVIRVEGSRKLTVSLEDWRKGDSVLERKGETVWFHRNRSEGIDSALRDICFGGNIAVKGSVATINVLTAKGDEWGSLLKRQVAVKADIEAARAAHRKWWVRFWDRSWIVATGILRRPRRRGGIFYKDLLRHARVAELTR